MGWGIWQLVRFLRGKNEIWTVSYVNTTNVNKVVISQGREELLDIEKDLFNMKVKQDIIVLPIWEYITEWLEKLLEVISKID